MLCADGLPIRFTENNVTFMFSWAMRLGPTGQLCRRLTTHPHPSLLALARCLAHRPANSPQPSRTSSSPSSHLPGEAWPPLLLDPPFTPIANEHAMRQRLSQRCLAQQSTHTSPTQESTTHTRNTRATNSSSRTHSLTSASLSSPSSLDTTSASSSSLLDYEMGYRCAHCRALLFCESDAECNDANNSSDGVVRRRCHATGWPAFVSPQHTRALRCRTRSQRCTLRPVSTNHASTTRIGVLSDSAWAACGGGGVGREDGVPFRRLSRSDMARRRRHQRPGAPHRNHASSSSSSAGLRSWREQCLRDVHARADPVVTEGCCAACGCPVCRVVVVNGRRSACWMRYVVNPSSVRAVVVRRRDGRVVEEDD